MELILAGQVHTSIKQLIDSYISSDHRIRLTGHLIKNDLVNLYNQSSVFVLPSLADSFGLVILEAMACGLPVIVTENTGGKDVVQESENGFVIPIRDVALLAEKLAWYYDNPKQRTEMGYSAQERCKEFTWEKYGERLIQFYQQLRF
jgi:glycosyltransferase involved in cell wall biosynthesis